MLPFGRYLNASWPLHLEVVDLKPLEKDTPRELRSSLGRRLLESEGLASIRATSSIAMDNAKGRQCVRHLSQCHAGKRHPLRLPQAGQTIAKLAKFSAS